MYRRSAGLLLLSATLLHVGNAHALAPVVLYSGTSAHLSHATSVFQIDPASGKAWVNLFVPQGFHTEELYERDLYVEGLRYDSTCLLYTSPSPRDGLLSRMPSSA